MSLYVQGASVLQDPMYRLLGPRGPHHPPDPHGPPPRAVLELSASTIPRLIHQVWLGSGAPDLLISTWQAYTLFAPESWVHRLWQSKEEVVQALAEVEDDLLRDWRRLYDQEATLAGSSDLIRWALLYAFGGVYIDADALWLGLPSTLERHLGNASFVAAWENKRSPFVATGVLASSRHGYVARQVLEMQVQRCQHCRLDLGRSPWDVFASGALTQLLVAGDQLKDEEVKVLDPGIFYPVRHSSDPWQKHGFYLPKLADLGAVSLDLGVTSNRYPSGAFAFGALPDTAATPNATEEGIVADADGQPQTRLPTFPRSHILQPTMGGEKQLMVVAHADDEVLFGSTLLAEGPEWTVVVATMPSEGYDQREAELLQALAEFPLVTEVRLLGYPECSKCVPLHPSLYDDFSRLLDRRWMRLVTHGPLGEYGHPQHRELLLALRSLGTGPVPVWVFQPRILDFTPPAARLAARVAALDAYASQAAVLALYRDWSSGAVPLHRFNYTLAREVCATGTRGLRLYQKTCSEQAGPLDVKLLRVDSVAIFAAGLAPEVAGAPHAALLEAPRLRRRLLHEAMRLSPDGFACTFGGTDTMLWLGASPDNTARILPFGPMLGRLWDDASRVLLWKTTSLAPRLQPFARGQPAQASSSSIRDCPLLIGPLAVILAFLRSAAAKVKASWNLCVHGLRDELLGLDAESVIPGEEEMALALSAAVEASGTFTPIQGSIPPRRCSSQDGWRRAWSWSAAHKAKVIQREVAATEHIGCCFTIERSEKQGSGKSVQQPSLMNQSLVFYKLLLAYSFGNSKLLDVWLREVLGVNAGISSGCLLIRKLLMLPARPSVSGHSFEVQPRFKNTGATSFGVISNMQGCRLRFEAVLNWLSRLSSDDLFTLASTCGECPTSSSTSWLRHTATSLQGAES
ncbi:unnamed protein product [Symbiodinium natans]|uniref:Uncharacterized protein n=1 Tax=Symbiodinium natans TaxID=878477 RepID=A0A812U3X5_9DINO|nr:unnamed protein product [Symbiodinium natans]